MSEYRAITITQGSGGFGGPLTVEPKEGKDVLLPDPMVSRRTCATTTNVLSR